VKPNLVHLWLSDKNLITQNIDGLDGKAGNQSYIPIHGRLDKVTFLHDQGTPVPIEDAPWDEIAKTCPDNDETLLKAALLDAFRISPKTLRPEPMVSLKPFVLLFDEYYTDLYRISEAEQRMQAAECFVFMGTSFSVNITNIALNHALRSGAAIHVVDPEPVDIGIPGIVYHAMKAQDYIAQ
jgi:NAD-dependent deacetylase